MKLVLKMPEGKPPFMGVLLENSDNRSYPEKLNEDLITEQRYADYRLVLEFVKNKLNLRLVADKSLITRHYSDLHYDGVKLLKWIYLVGEKNTRSFNFGHVILEKGREVMVRTWGQKKIFVLGMMKYDIETRDEGFEKAAF